MKPAFAVIVCAFSTPHVTGRRQLRLIAGREALATGDVAGEGLVESTDGEAATVETEGPSDGEGLGLICAMGDEALVHAVRNSTPTTAAPFMQEST